MPGTDTGDNVSNDLGISLVSLRHKSATDADEATEGVSDIYGLDSDSLLDIGSDRIFFRPGDLVELTFVPLAKFCNTPALTHLQSWKSESACNIYT